MNLNTLLLFSSPCDKLPMSMRIISKLISSLNKHLTHQQILAIRGFQCKWRWSVGFLLAVVWRHSASGGLGMSSWVLCFPALVNLIRNGKPQPFNSQNPRVPKDTWIKPYNKAGDWMGLCREEKGGNAPCFLNSGVEGLSERKHADYCIVKWLLIFPVCLNP